MNLRFSRDDYIVEAARLRTSDDPDGVRNSEMIADATEYIDALQNLLSTSISEVYRLIDQLTTTAFEEGWRAANKYDQRAEDDDLVADWKASVTLATLQAMPGKGDA
jgi:hypothetical protein